MNRTASATTTPADQTGLRLICKQALTGPVIHCDSCGKKIKKASMGAVVWDESLGEGETAAPIFLCKGEDYGFTRCLNASQYKCLPWSQLDTFLGHLLHNVGIRTVKDYRNIAESSKHEASV